MAFLSKYGEARVIEIPLVKRAVVDFAVGADFTPVAGDVKITKDGGAAANVTNLPTALVMGNGAVWSFSLTATELTAARIIVTVIDAATKAVEDQSFIIDTYGNASAQHAFDLDTALASQTVGTATAVTTVNGLAANVITAASIEAAALNGKGDWNIGKTGYALSAAGVQAIWDALTSALTFAGSVGKLLVDNINATISSRSSHNAADVWASAARTLTAATNITSTGGTTVPQTGDSFARLGAPAGASISADIATRATPAQVNTEVVDALNVDTYVEPTAVPAATNTLAAKIGWLFTIARNKITQTATTQTLRNDGDAANVGTAAVSDDATTFTRAKWL